jgi:glycosyltransferase involved in cell wall biosynthesis
MRYYELMVASTARTIFCASSEHKQLMQVAWLGHHCPIEVVGLPFDMQDVRRRVADWKPREDRENRVVYSSRWDREKQPHFFLNVVNRMQGTEFIVCTGSEELRGEPTAVQRAHEFEAAGKLTILRDCTKEQYFSTLASARVHFLCSLQDWVSYSLLDASACGTPTVAPCFRSFPEAVGSDPARLYTPWNASEAVSKISALLNTDDMPSEKVEAPARYHTETIERIAQVVRERSS